MLTVGILFLDSLSSGSVSFADGSVANDPKAVDEALKQLEIGQSESTVTKILGPPAHSVAGKPPSGGNTPSQWVVWLAKRTLVTSGTASIRLSQPTSSNAKR